MDVLNHSKLLRIIQLHSARIRTFIVHEIKHEKRLWKRYLQFIQFLNINPNAKPVWLFFLTLIACSSSLVSYTIYNIISLLTSKSKVGSLISTHRKRESTNSILNLKKRFSLSSSKSSKHERIIHVPYKNKLIQVKLETPNADKYERDKLIFKKYMKEHDSNSSVGSISSASSLSSTKIRFQFFEKLTIIWNLILVPQFFNKNATLLLSHVIFLFARTWLTLLVTKLDGQITKDLMSFNIKYFMRDMVYWFLFAVPASYINASIHYLTRRISLNFRTNLVRYCHDLYMDSKLVYYKLQYNIDSNVSEEFKMDPLLFNQYITDDIKSFCESLTNLFTNVGKPAVDLVFFAIYLRDNIGSLGILGILLNYFVTGIVLKNYSPNFSKLWKVENFFEGLYYNYNLNLINNCEEISFYKGISFERLKVQEIFNKLMSHLRFDTITRFRYQLLEDYILKSVWPTFGYIFAAIPILFDSTESVASSNIKSFTVNKRLILSMADAGSRLMYSIKDISQLSGLTDKIFTLLVNLHQVHDMNFNYGYADTKSNRITGGFGSTYNMSSFASRPRLAIGHGNMNPKTNSPAVYTFEHGTIQKNFPGLRFEHISVIPPSPKGPYGKPILRNLNFKILQGENLLIHGKNGCGKTSIVRIISELWPLFNNGLLSKPSNMDIFFVSQKQYFVSGSLRDQVIYPLNWANCVERGDDDTRIRAVLKDVGLEYLLDRFGGLDYNPHGAGSKLDEIYINDQTIELIDSYVPGGVDGKTSWENLLSGGERQKLIFARVLFHAKKVVVLDEPTSAISYDFEDILFETLKKRGFTLVTISNRESLIKYHDYILKLNPHPIVEDEFSSDSDNMEDEISDGVFQKVDEEYLSKFETLDSEISYLEKEMDKINAMKERRSQLVELLSGYE